MLRFKNRRNLRPAWVVTLWRLKRGNPAMKGFFVPWKALMTTLRNGRQSRNSMARQHHDKQQSSGARCLSAEITPIPCVAMFLYEDGPRWPARKKEPSAMYKAIRSFLREECGATAIEYRLIAVQAASGAPPPPVRPLAPWQRHFRLRPLRTDGASRGPVYQTFSISR